MSDDGFRGRPHDEGLGQLFTAADGYHGQLRGKTLDVMLFLLDKVLGNEERKRDILMTRRLEAAVERLLDVLPERPTVGAHDHAAAHRRVIGELGAQYELVVPLRKIFAALR